MNFTHGIIFTFIAALIICAIINSTILATQADFSRCYLSGATFEQCLDVVGAGVPKKGN